MRVYLKENVFQAATSRIQWLFQEFDNIVIGVSGGKDSTVVFNIALTVAREMDRLPLRVMFLDQEAEWQATVDMIKKIMYHPDVDPLWYQIPIKIFNATSSYDQWLECWDESEKEKWVHPKDPISIKENTFGTDRFHDIFPAIAKALAPDSPIAYISGVRAEESPLRSMGLVQGNVYKGIPWGKVLNKKLTHITTYPIYDWKLHDVWKAIHSNKWEYNKIYDKLFQYGVPIREMRVSNLHHETAVKNLFYLQEIDPKTYARLTRRLKGIDTAGKLNKTNYFVDSLPFMFRDWKEYRDYLLEKFITDEMQREKLHKKFTWFDGIFQPAGGEPYYKAEVQCILTHDWEGVKHDNYRTRPTKEGSKMQSEYRKHGGAKCRK